MTKLFKIAFVLAATLALATSSFALEKSAVRLVEDGKPDGWNAGTTCSIVYYNTCTGWVWIWSGWSSGDMVGVCFDACCPGDLVSNWQYVWTTAPSGYGFTGEIKVYDTANCCLGNLLASQVYLPASGWNLFTWGIPVGAQFAIVGQFGVSAFPNPTALPTDHPAAGPTGPVACGTCYPTTRAAHTFYYGTKATPLCPGSPLNDGVCDAEHLLDAQMACAVSVQEQSWSKIKALYR